MLFSPAKFSGRLQILELLPLRLLNPNLVQHPGKLVSILSTVNTLGRSAQDPDLLSMQGHGDVIGQLTSNAEDDSRGIFQLVNVQNGFRGDFLKVQFVTHVVICADRFWIVV